MKKAIIFLSAFLLSAVIFGQVSKGITFTKPTDKDSLTVQLKPVMKSVTIDTTKTVVIPKEEVKALQVTADSSKAKDSIITKKETEIAKLKSAADTYLWNGLPKEFYFYGILFVLLGVLLSWALKALYGMTSDATTSNKWDWSEFLKPANVKKRLASFLSSFLAAFFTIRFAADWFGQEATMAYCAGVGLTLDFILAWYWNKRKSFAPKKVQDDVPPQV